MAHAPLALVGASGLWSATLPAAAIVVNKSRGPWRGRFTGDSRSTLRLVSTSGSAGTMVETEKSSTSMGLNQADELPFGFGFSAGGLLFPYLVGVACGLQDVGLLSEDSKLAGASAGSLVAGCLHSGLTGEDMMEGCRRVAEDCREKGTRGRLKKVLFKVLSDILPEDCHLRCSGKTYVAITEIYPRFGGRLLSDFHSRSDFLDALMTSCHIPVWFDNTFVTGFREGLSTDGGLANLIPSPPDSRPVRICCFPTKGWGEGLKVDIAPDKFRECKYPMSQMVAWAFEPPELDETLWELMEMGRSDAVAFKESEPARVVADDGDGEGTATIISRLRTMFVPRL